MGSVLLNFKCYGQKFGDTGDSSIKSLVYCACSTSFSIAFPSDRIYKLDGQFWFSFWVLKQVNESQSHQLEDRAYTKQNAEAYRKVEYWPVY